MFGCTHLLRGVLVFWQLDHLTGHLVNTLYDSCRTRNRSKISANVSSLFFRRSAARCWHLLTEHLVVGDGSVAVNVVELEGPSQLLVEPSSRCHAECADELLKVDGAVLVLVENVEHVFCKRGRISKGEELFVDAAELLLVERSGWAVLEEALVPLLQLLPVDCSSEICGKILCQLRAAYRTSMPARITYSKCSSAGPRAARAKAWIGSFPCWLIRCFSVDRGRGKR